MRRKTRLFADLNLGNKSKLFLYRNTFSVSSGCLKLKPYSYRHVIKILGKLGFKIVRQRGSHIVLKGFYKERNRTVVVPKHNEIAVGTLSAILFQAGITVEEFVNLEKKS